MGSEEERLDPSLLEAAEEARREAREKADPETRILAALLEAGRPMRFTELKRAARVSDKTLARKLIDMENLYVFQGLDERYEVLWPGALKAAGVAEEAAVLAYFSRFPSFKALLEAVGERRALDYLASARAVVEEGLRVRAGPLEAEVRFAPEAEGDALRPEGFDRALGLAMLDEAFHVGVRVWEGRPELERAVRLAGLKLRALALALNRFAEGRGGEGERGIYW